MQNELTYGSKAGSYRTFVPGPILCNGHSVQREATLGPPKDIQAPSLKHNAIVVLITSATLTKEKRSPHFLKGKHSQISNGRASHQLKVASIEENSQNHSANPQLPFFPHAESLQVDPTKIFFGGEGK